MNQVNLNMFSEMTFDCGCFIKIGRAHFKEFLITDIPLLILIYYTLIFTVSVLSFIYSHPPL